MTYTGTKEQIQQFIFKLDKDIMYDIKVDKHRKKRSLDANNYAWHLITEISNVMRLSKEEVYVQFLKEYGQREYVCLLANIEPSRISKYYEKQGTFKQNGNIYTSYMFYVGTSQYDSYEMSIFIDGLVQEARNLGIQTLEDLEIEVIIKEMEGEVNEKNR